MNFIATPKTNSRSLCVNRMGLGGVGFIERASSTAIHSSRNASASVASFRAVAGKPCAARLARWTVCVWLDGLARA
jgi:hypothetical protein